MTATALERDTEAVDQLIARVLSRAHRTTEALGSPDEARALLHVARAFADELAALDPRFDRMQFTREATEDPS
jgi:cob(I)alamin adenosyltransferase